MSKLIDKLNRQRQCNVFVNFELKTRLCWHPETTYFESCYLKDVWLYPFPTGWQIKTNKEKIISALENDICRNAFLTPDGYTLVHVGWKTIDCDTHLKGTIDYTNKD